MSSKKLIKKDKDHVFWKVVMVSIWGGYDVVLAHISIFVKISFLTYFIQGLFD